MFWDSWSRLLSMAYLRFRGLFVGCIALRSYSPSRVSTVYGAMLRGYADPVELDFWSGKHRLLVKPSFDLISVRQIWKSPSTGKR